MTNEKFKQWNSWLCWTEACRIAFKKLYLQMRLYLSGFALILCHFLYYSTVFCIFSLFLASTPLHLFSLSLLPHLFPCLSLSSLWLFLSLFSCLDVFPPFLHFFLDTLLTDHNMRLTSISKHVFKRFILSVLNLEAGDWSVFIPFILSFSLLLSTWFLPEARC